MQQIKKTLQNFLLHKKILKQRASKEYILCTYILTYKIWHYSLRICKQKSDRQNTNPAKQTTKSTPGQKLQILN